MSGRRKGADGQAAGRRDRRKARARRFSASLRGYSPEEVDRYLDRLTGELDDLRRDHARVSQELQQARTDLDRARADLVAARSETGEAMAELEKAHADLDRYGASPADYETRLAALDLLIAAVARQLEPGTSPGELDAGRREGPTGPEVATAETRPVATAIDPQPHQDPGDEEWREEVHRIFSSPDVAHPDDVFEPSRPVPPGTGEADPGISPSEKERADDEPAPDVEEIRSLTEELEAVLADLQLRADPEEPGPGSGGAPEE